MAFVLFTTCSLLIEQIPCPNVGEYFNSQNSPKLSQGPIPTSITFNKNPLVTLKGSVNEIGNLEKHYDTIFKADVKQFRTKVDFVQTLKLKSEVNTTISASIKYMVCDNK